MSGPQEFDGTVDFRDQHDSSRSRGPTVVFWGALVALSVLLIVLAIGWARAVLARQDLAWRLDVEQSKLRRETEALRRERDAADAARRAIESSLAKDGFRPVAARQTLERGRALAEAGRVDEGLLWMARALEYTSPDDAALQRTIRTNLDAWPAWMARLEGELTLPQGAVLRPDGLAAAAPTADGRVRILRVSDGGTEGTDLPTGDPPLCFSRDGGTLLVRSAQRGLARVWDVRTAQPVGPEIPTSKEQWAETALSPDGSLLAVVVSKGALQIVKTSTGVDVCPPLTLPRPVEHAVFDPSGKRLLVITNDVGLWFDVPSGQPSKPPYDRPSSGLSRDRVLFGPNGRFLAQWGGRSWFTTFDGLGRFSQHRFTSRTQDAVSALAVGHEGRRIASADGKGWLRVWDAAAGQQEFPAFRHPDQPRGLALAFQPDDRVLVTLHDGHALRWRLADKLTAGPLLPTSREYAGEPRALTSRDGARILERKAAAGDEAERVVLRSASGDGPVTELVRGPARLLAASRDGALAALVDRSRRPASVRVFRFRDGLPVGKPLPHPNGVRRAAVAPDGRLVATGDELNTLQVWDLESGSPVGSALTLTDEITALDYSVDGVLLLVGMRSGEARLYDALDRTPVGGPMTVQTLGDFRSPVVVDVGAFAPDGRTFEVAGPSSESWKRRVPSPIQGDAAQVSLWVSTLTGLELNAFDQVAPLSSERWRRLRQNLQLGAGDATSP